MENAIHFNYVSVRGGSYTRQASCVGVWLVVVREQGNSNVHRLVVQGKHRSGEVEQALAGEATDYFLFWYSVSIFFQRYMCFSSVCCRWLIFSPVVYSVGCRQRAYPARSDIMVRTVPSIARLLLQVSLWLIESWLALLFLAGNGVIAWLFALIANCPSSPWP